MSSQSNFNQDKRGENRRRRCLRWTCDSWGFGCHQTRCLSLSFHAVCMYLLNKVCSSVSACSASSEEAAWCQRVSCGWLTGRARRSEVKLTFLRATVWQVQRNSAVTESGAHPKDYTSQHARQNQRHKKLKAGWKMKESVSSVLRAEVSGFIIILICQIVNVVPISATGGRSGVHGFKLSFTWFHGLFFINRKSVAEGGASVWTLNIPYERLNEGVCDCMNVFMNVCENRWMNVRMNGWMSVCMNDWMNVCMTVFWWLWTGVWMCDYEWTCVWTGE